MHRYHCKKSIGSESCNLPIHQRNSFIRLQIQFEIEIEIEIKNLDNNHIEKIENITQRLRGTNEMQNDLRNLYEAIDRDDIQTMH